MIVNYTDKGWEIITQRAHGILAAKLATHWSVKNRPERWTETLLAIAEHDDAEVELRENKLLTKEGGPRNFDMKKFDYGHCERLSALTITKSRYIALLVSMHMEFLYRKYAKVNSDASSFLRGQSRLRIKWRRQLGLNKTEAEKIYAIMEWFDACSLLLCQHDIPPENRMIEISHGSKKECYQLFQMTDGCLSVVPWPFEENRFEVSVEARTITQLSFKSAGDIKKAFKKAQVKELKWQFRKTPPVVKKKLTKI